MENGVKLYQYHISKNTSCAYIRYFLLGESAIWKKYGSYMHNRVKYDIFIFTPEVTEAEVTDLIKKGADAFSNAHPYRVFSKRVQKHPLSTPVLKASIEILKVKTSKNKHITKEVFQKYNGYYEIKTTDSSSYPMTIMENNEIKYIHSILFVVSEFNEIIQRSNCIELDCSFYLMRPYVYCMPHWRRGKKSPFKSRGEPFIPI